MAETYDVYFGTVSGSLTKVSSGQSGLSLAMPGLPLDYGIIYYWRVDATNEYGTTTGDTWYFTSIAFQPPVLSWDPPNMMAVQKRLVVAAGNVVWYEEN
jgi:hypothetical protein